MMKPDKMRVARISCPHVKNNRHYWTALMPVDPDNLVAGSGPYEEDCYVPNRIMSEYSHAHNSLIKPDGSKVWPWGQGKIVQYSSTGFVLKDFGTEWQPDDDAIVASMRCINPVCLSQWPTDEHLTEILTRSDQETIDLSVSCWAPIDVQQIVIDHMVVMKSQILAELRQEIESIIDSKYDAKKKKKQEKADEKVAKRIAKAECKLIMEKKKQHQLSQHQTQPAPQAQQNPIELLNSSTASDQTTAPEATKMRKHLPENFFIKCDNCDVSVTENQDGVVYVSMARNDAGDIDLTNLCPKCVDAGVHHHRVMLRLPSTCAYRPNAVHPAIEAVLRSFKKHARITEHHCGANCPLVKPKEEEASIEQSLDKCEKLTEMMQQYRAKIADLDTAVERSFPAQAKQSEQQVVKRDSNEQQQQDEVEKQEIASFLQSLESSDDEDDMSLLDNRSATINNDEYELVDEDDDIAYPSTGRQSEALSEYEDADDTAAKPEMFVSTTTTVVDSMQQPSLEETKEDSTADVERQEKVPEMIVGSRSSSPVLFASATTNNVTATANSMTTTAMGGSSSTSTSSSTRIVDDLRWGVDQVTSAASNVAMQIGRAATLKQQQWSPPPPQNPFKRLAKGAKPDEYIGWAPKATQTPNVQQIPKKFQGDLIDIDESVGEGLAKMLEMGFEDVSKIVKALRAANGNVERACAALIDEQ